MVIKKGEVIWTIPGMNRRVKVLKNYVDGKFPFSREISTLTERYYYYLFVYKANVIPRSLVEEEINNP